MNQMKKNWNLFLRISLADAFPFPCDHSNGIASLVVPMISRNHC